MPTRERLFNAGGAFEIGGSGVNRVLRMLDSPLEQQRARGNLTDTQFGVLAKLRVHWYLGHQAGSLHAIDLNRVIASSGRPLSEVAMWHREMFDAACGVMLTLEREVAVRVVIEECSVNEAGAALGYRSPYRGRKAVIGLLRDAAGKIMSAWLTMERRGT